MTSEKPRPEEFSGKKEHLGHLEIETLNGGRLVLFYSPEQNGDETFSAISSWWLLSPEEVLVKTSLRKAGPLVNVEERRPGNNEFVVAIDTSKPDSLRVLDPLQQRMNNLNPHGLLERNKEEIGPTLFYQIQEVRRRIVPIIIRKIEEGEGIVLAKGPEGTTCLLLVNEELSQNTAIEGDPNAQNKKLRQPRRLLRAGDPLVITVSHNGDVVFNSSRSGRALVTSPNATVFAKEIGIQTKRRDVIIHIIKNLVSRGQIIAKGENAELDGFRPKTSILERMNEILSKYPPSLRAYLEQRLNIHVSTREGNVPLEELPPEDLEYILLQPENLHQELAATAEFLRDLKEEVRDVTYKAGLSYLNREPAQRLLERLYNLIKKKVEGISWDEIESLGRQLNDPQLTHRLANIKKRYSNVEQWKQAFATYWCARRFREIVSAIGLRNFNPALLKNIDFPPYEEVFARAESLLAPQPGFTQPEITKRALRAQREITGDTTPIYETPHTSTLRAKLEALGHGTEALIPWRWAEGPFVISPETLSQMQEFATAVALGFAVAKEVYLNPERVRRILNYPKDSDRCKQIMSLSQMIREVITFALPSYLPTPGEIPSLNLPLVFTRPDLARSNRGWVATELENSPGGLGMQYLIRAGYEQAETLSTLWAKFMKSIPLPASADIFRGRLTILMTEEWGAYRKEAELFAKLLDQQGISTEVVTLEELAEKDGNIPPGFVFHFAYPWNFIKNRRFYHLNLMLNPEKNLKTTGIELKDILQKEFINDNGEVDWERLKKRIQEIEEDAVAMFRASLKIPADFIRSRLLERVYREEALKQIQKAGEEYAQQLMEKALSIYNRQGRDLMIFNDPSMGAIFTKVGIAILQLPFFEEVYRALLQKYSFPTETVEKYISSLRKGLALTIPMIENPQNPYLKEFVEKYFNDALNNKDRWILKLAVDAQFGAFDWGSRGIIVGAEVSEEEWKARLHLARASNAPWVLQEKVENPPFSEPRNRKIGGEINEDQLEQVGLFVKDPNNSIFHVGDLISVPVRARFNPFCFVCFGNAQGEMTTLVDPGIVTLRPSRPDDPFVAVHGATDSAMIPVIVKS